MKTEIKYTKDYTLLLDLEGEIDRLSYVIGNGVDYIQDVVSEVTEILDEERVVVNTTTALNKKGLIKVIAYRKINPQVQELDLPLLPEFEDVRKLAKDEYKYNHKKVDKLSFRLGFEIGYETAQQRGTFTLEDMKEAITESWNTCEDNENEETFTQCFNRIIQSLSTQQLPKEFKAKYWKPEKTCIDCEHGFIMDKTYRCPKCGSFMLASVLYEYPILKTTINSEGKEVVVGK